MRERETNVRGGKLAHRHAHKQTNGPRGGTRRRWSEAQGKRHKTLTDRARQAILQAKRWLADRSVVVVADSSFAGAAQSTASIYFGDVQLGYSGADPSIRLYDMQSVEVMEGPQGTLYGTGSIGGVIRLTPKAVDLTRFGGSADDCTCMTFCAASFSK